MQPVTLTRLKQRLALAGLGHVAGEPVQDGQRMLPWRQASQA